MEQAKMLKPVVYHEDRKIEVDGYRKQGVLYEKMTVSTALYVSYPLSDRVSTKALTRDVRWAKNNQKMAQPFPINPQELEMQEIVYIKQKCYPQTSNGAVVWHVTTQYLHCVKVPNTNWIQYPEELFHKEDNQPPFWVVNSKL